MNGENDDVVAGAGAEELGAAADAEETAGGLRLLGRYGCKDNDTGIDDEADALEEVTAGTCELP